MQEWWETLTSFEKVFWYIAIPFSVILLIQIILTFIGIGGGSADVGHDVIDDPGVDVHSDHTHLSEGHYGFSFFTLRNFIAFFTVFGWAGIVGIKTGFSPAWVIGFGMLCGLVIMVIISTLFYFISRMTDSGNIDLHNAINQIGSVYLPIKAKAGNVGKIQVNVQDSNRELQAITNGGADLPTGTVVRVTGIVSGNILVVERVNK